MTIAFSKVKSSTIEAGKRILKILYIGGDVKTAKESYPFGFDSHPPADLTAIYAETSNRGESVIIGYINKKQLAGIGESRMYAVGSSGEEVAFVYARSNGNLELNGSQYSAVRFQELQAATNQANTLINAELAKIAIAVGTVGGSYIVVPISTNMAAAESPNVKLE